MDPGRRFPAAQVWFSRRKATGLDLSTLTDDVDKDGARGIGIVLIARKRGPVSGNSTFSSDLGIGSGQTELQHAVDLVTRTVDRSSPCFLSLAPNNKQRSTRQGPPSHNGANSSVLQTKMRGFAGRYGIYPYVHG